MDAGKVEQCRASAYARSIAKNAPRDASVVEKSSLRLRRPTCHADEHHDEKRSHKQEDRHRGDAQKKPRHAKNRDLER